MTPKEKAKELVGKYMGLSNECNCLEYMCVCFTMYPSKAKQGALICVDEIIKCLQGQITEAGHIDIIYWQKVKQEIERI